MKQKLIYLLWLFLYIICVGLGTLQNEPVVLQVFQGLFALLFYVPPVLLVLEGLKKRKYLIQLRVISITSLVLTLGFMIANIASAAYGTAAIGETLHQLNILVTAPKDCLPYEFISMFLWACLLMLTFPRLWKEKK